jgi:hypothetical protein
VAVAAEFSADSAMAVMCGIGFRRGTVLVDEPAQKPGSAGWNGIQYGRHGKYWSGGIAPNAKMRLEARFLAAECGTDTIFAEANEAHPPQGPCVVLPGDSVAPVRAAYFVRSGIPICIRGRRVPREAKPQEEQPAWDVLQAYPIGSAPPDSLANPRAGVPHLPSPVVGSVPPDPPEDPRVMMRPDPCCEDPR